MIQALKLCAYIYIYIQFAEIYNGEILIRVESREVLGMASIPCTLRQTGNINFISISQKMTCLEDDILMCTPIEVLRFWKNPSAPDSKRCSTSIQNMFCVLILLSTGRWRGPHLSHQQIRFICLNNKHGMPVIKSIQKGQKTHSYSIDILPSADK